jgi:hypothetical protein
MAVLLNSGRAYFNSVKEKTNVNVHKTKPESNVRYCSLFLKGNENMEFENLTEECAVQQTGA